MSGEIRMADLGAALEHHGVKGMRWGHRKAKTSGGDTPPKRLSRKEVRQINKQGREEFNQKRINDVLAKASKHGEGVLLKTRLPGDEYPTIVTGKEFIEHISKGGAFDVRMTDIYATKDEKAGAYVLNEERTPQYQKVKR